MKRFSCVIPFALLLCFMVGCQDKEAMAELEKFKAQAEAEEQNKVLIGTYFKEMDNGDYNFVMDSIASDAKIFFPSGNSSPSSREETLQGLKSWYESFPDYKHGIKQMVAKGDIVLVRAIDTGTHEGEFQGVPATGNKLEVGAVIIFRIRSGKIVELWEEMDMLGLMQQLGMELKPKEDKE